ncbi:hypothetical protein [Mesoterricola silvestris]|uniref:TonB C-terminal domain-containing protein n=1 Tax=Mesoterricola silvestris TaxID=2927979 RepID=A0AA48GQY8_9BACT|nr:hypothetical protein [Mesoterricola silvestris]BDU74504.1 hypothetical protein METEAL_36780 [Mesoterricola silvestris]
MQTLFEPDLELELALSGVGEGRRGLSLALAAGLTLALVWGLGALRLRAADRQRAVVSGLRIAVDLVQEPGLREAPSPGRPGDPNGTGTVDPALLKYQALQAGLPRASSFTPDLDLDPPRALPGEPTLLDLAPGLPVARGGNGMAKGDGGSRPARAAAAPPARLILAQPLDDDEFRIIRQPIPVVKGARRDIKGSVLVRLSIGADGVPLTATPLGGPPEIWPKIVETVLQWRFHVPERMRAQAPIRLDVNFSLQTL